MGRHLTFDDRLEIQAGLNLGKSTNDIAEGLGRNRSVISREIDRHTQTRAAKGNDCIHRNECRFPDACGKCRQLSPLRCGRCMECIDGCSRYEAQGCAKISRPPYLCNGCSRGSCPYEQKFYNAKKAQEEYENILSDSRRGISLTEDELSHLDSIVSGPLKNGQSIAVVCEGSKDNMEVSGRTVYRYINAGLLGAGPLDLSRTVQRKPHRKKSGIEMKVDKACHIGRTYEDLSEFRRRNPDAAEVEIDSVIGRKGGKAILTVYFRNCGLQMLFLRERNTAATVSEVFIGLREKLGDNLYSAMFETVITDRGSEFTDPGKIERGSWEEESETLCSVFYCDPMNSNQKAECERNHEFIRKVLPKGTSFDSLTQDDVSIVMNHVNSYPRAKMGFLTPMDLFVQIYSQEIATLLGLKKIELSEVVLTPALLRK